MMSLSCNLKKLSEHYTRTQRKPRGTWQSNMIEVPAHIYTFTPVLQQHRDLVGGGGAGGVSGQNKTVDIKWWTAVWILEQQSLMKSGDGATGYLLHSQL